MPAVDRIGEFHDEMTTWRRDIHAHPELGFEEHRTSDLVAKRLEEFGLSFDLQLNSHQFRKAARLVARHPGIPIVIGHLGSPTLDDLREGAVYWDGLEALADVEQVYLKVSMLSYPDRDWDRNELVRESALRAIDLFGPGRCMFASNFPVEKRMGWPADRLYGAFRELSSHLGADDRQRLFADSARRAYGPPD